MTLYMGVKLKPMNKQTELKNPNLWIALGMWLDTDLI